MGAKKTAKRWISLFLVCILALPLQFMPVQAAETDEVITLKSSATDSVQLNYFKYTAYEGKEWTLNASESYIDLGESDSRAEECYFEIYFRGNAIKVSAAKGPAHGIVKYTIDGGHEQIVDLYNANRQESVVYQVSGLTEGDHVLKAVTQTSKSGTKIVNQVVSAEITHQPYKGGTPDLGGTIVDTDTQYTQDRYGEVIGKNVLSGRLSAWRNDKAVGELVLFSRNCSLEDVQIQAGALTCGDAVISSEHVKTTFIKSAKAYNGSYLGYGDPNRGVPAETASNRSETSDILYQEGGSVEIGWNSLQPVWVEFDIPKDAKAGSYTGTLTATAKDFEHPITFTYTVDVQDAVLPDAEEWGGVFDIELWQYPYSSAEYYRVEPFSEAHLEIMRSSMLKYKEIGGHAITTSIVEEAWNGQTYSANEVHYPSMIKWTKNADGSFSYNYSDFDKWVEFCKSLGIGDKIVLYSIAPWHNSFTYWEGDTLVKEGFSAGDDRYTQVWTAFLTDLIAHLEEKGWFDESYIGIDERGFSAAAFDLIDSVKNSKGKSLKTAGAMDGFVNKMDLAMRVTDLNIGDNAAAAHAAEFAELLANREEKGLRTTLYSCTEHSPGNFSLSIPAESYWSVVNAAKMGTAGFLRWAYDAWVEDPLRDTTHNAFEPGDCFLIFPDEKDAANPQSKSSVRLERMAEAVRDVNKLRLIEKEKPQYSEEIQDLYAKIQTAVGTSRSYMSDSAKSQLIEEMTAFKAGVEEISEKYIWSEREGLHVFKPRIEMETGETREIESDLVTAGEDKTIVYESKDKSVATVDAKGIVTARGAGETTIVLVNRPTGYTASVKIRVTEKEPQPMRISNTLTDYKLPEKYLSDLYQGPQTGDEHYLGQPDMIMLDDQKTLYTVFPVGHGVGRIIMMVSHDAGETWEKKENIPESWRTSYETPTIYKLNMTNGETKLILISGRPASFGAATGGWDTSVSTDGGETWSEFQTYCETFADGSRNDTVVAMASLVQMKENGEYIDKWMGVYHDGNTFVNYKTYLTFDKEGNQQWSMPEPYLSEWRETESSHQICEVGMFRSPDGNRIVALARNQTHNGPATMFYSDDEGENWTKPVAMPGSLAGERHKILYDPTDPTGQRLIVTFREIIYDLNGNNQFDGGNDWLAGDWIAWVGTYEDIIEGREGSYRIRLCEDWAANAKSGDTGYTGMAVLPDGTFILDTYGHWNREYSESLPNYNVYNDHCWIKQAKFKLSDIDESLRVPELKETIEQELEKLPQYSDVSCYTASTWGAYEQALQKVEQLKASENVTYSEMQEAYAALEKAYEGLVMRGTDEDLILNAQQALQQALQRADVKKGTTCVSWTTESWKVFIDAYNEAKAAVDSTDLEELERLQKKLMDATDGLTVASWGPPETEFEADGSLYRIINAAEGTVKLIKGTDTKKITINSVARNGKSYKVTAIASNAFLKCKKLQNITIGANVTSIEKNAFYNCTKIKKVIFKGKKLPAMKKAFKKTNKKLTVKVQKNLKKKASIKNKTMKTLKKAGLKVTLNNIK